jgi:dihydrolipoamide dehydrogenase
MMERTTGEQMIQETFDVVVLGGGGGGVPAAIRAAQLGGQVCLVESRHLGGLCMNRGCIPFCHMMTASSVLANLSFAKELGLDTGETLKDLGALVRRQQDLISFMGEGVKGLLAKNKVQLLEGRGNVAGKGRIQVGDRTVSCKSIILATGAKWAKPEFPGSDLEDIVDGDYFLRTSVLPERVLLYGRSPWIVEVAQFLNRFGSKVVLATPEKRLLVDESHTIATRLKKSLSADGISIKASAGILAARKESSGLQVDLGLKEGVETMAVDKMAILDRRAAIDNLGLNVLGLNENGTYLKVNEKMETGADGVYAIGDLTGPLSRHYSSLASAGGLVAAENAMGVSAAINPKTFSRVLFTRPQVACVGLTKEEAKNKGYEVLVGSAPYSMNAMGMILSEMDGIVEIVAEKKYGELLGVHFFGASATEMVGQGIIAIQMEMTLEEVSKLSFPHPTLSESFSEAARDAMGRSIYLP